jgi:hypothetical protein
MINSVTETRIADIIKNLNNAGDSLFKASQIYADAVNEDPEFILKARERAPWIRQQTWTALDMCASGSADWRVAFGISPHSRLMLNLPAKLQSKALDTGVDIAIGADVVRMQVGYLTTRQARDIFKNGTIATPSEQAARIFSLKVPPKKKKKATLWRCTGSGSIEVLFPCILTKSDILDMLSSIEGV